MQTDYNTYEGLRAILEKETPILIAHWDPIIRMDTGRKNIFIFHCFL